MPPAAAFECERTGWTLLMIATVAPALAAARAARCPASPAPMMRTSCAGMARNLIRELVLLLCGGAAHQDHARGRRLLGALLDAYDPRRLPGRVRGRGGDGARGGGRGPD